MHHELRVTCAGIESLSPQSKVSVNAHCMKPEIKGDKLLVFTNEPMYKLEELKGNGFNVSVTDRALQITVGWRKLRNEELRNV